MNSKVSHSFRRFIADSRSRIKDIPATGCFAPCGLLMRRGAHRRRGSPGSGLPAAPPWGTLPPVESRTLTIAINDRPLRQPRTGVGHYIDQLLRWLPKVAPQHRYVGFFTDVLGWRPPEVGTAVPAAAPGTPVGRPPWFARRLLQGAYHTAFRFATGRGRCDLYHEPNHIAMRWKGVTVTTVHDLSVVRHPEWHPDDRVAWYERDFEPSLAQSAHFICPSEFTRNELVELAGVAADRITVIPLAPRAPFVPQTPQAVAAVRARLSLPETFLLFVGTLEPRKNLHTLLEAYAQLLPAMRQRFPLVLAGAAGWGPGDLWHHAARLGVQRHLLPIGYVTDEDLACLYTAAAVLVWPSWYEGFGLPPLECMACGTPVITSNTSSLPEVVADAAITVDPGDPAVVAGAIRSLLDDKGRAADLSDRGRRRAAAFTWQRCAAAHVAVYEKCAAGS